jgi:hypothetical protein
MDAFELCKFCYTRLMPLDYYFKDGTTIITFNYRCMTCNKKVEIYFNHKSNFKTCYYENKKS